jgi:hypothetical protein
MSAQISSDTLASYVPFSKEVGKVNRKPVTFPWVEGADISIYWKLHPCLDPDRAVHPEYAGAEKKLLSLTGRHLQALSLKRAGSFPG